jgi:RNA polymerase sigma-70 factor, ECF subfamily
MVRINLRDYYPFYSSDCFVDVEDNVAMSLKSFDLLEEAYRIRTYRNRAYYSLDQNEGIERDCLFATLSPYEVYEQDMICRELYMAISNLPDKQCKRIYAHYFLGVSKSAIARIEGIGESAVRESIKCGLKNIKVFLERFR